MPHAKLAVLGAASYVFGPGVLKDVIVEHQLDGLELALMDPDRSAVELFTAVGRRMADELVVHVDVTAHTRRYTALDGADFVLCAAANDLPRRFEIDGQIIDRLSPGHGVTESGGVAGISCSLRQIALIHDIVADMRRLCPKAWLLNVANPLSRVLQAAHEEGIRTVGFCSSSLGAYRAVWQILRNEQVVYPFEPARSRLDLTTAGLNRLSWVLHLNNPYTGDDLYPELRAKAADNHSLCEPITRTLLEQTGYLPAPGDNCLRDFLPPQTLTPTRLAHSSGTPQQRQARLDLLRDIAEKKTPWSALMDCDPWEKPVNLIASMYTGKTSSFHALNLINRGQIASLPSNIFVETPAVGTRLGPMPEKVELPQPILPYCHSAAQLTQTIVQAAGQRRRDLLHQAIDLDPTIIDKSAALTALDACLEAHRDILPVFQ